jgi:hypothetical protein
LAIAIFSMIYASYIKSMPYPFCPIFLTQKKTR